MSSELLNNYISNKPVIQPVAITAVQPVQKAQGGTIDTTVKTDSFEKKSDKKSIIAITMGTLLLGGGFILLAKKGKFGEGVQGFINKLFGGSKTAESAANNKGKIRSYDDMIEGGSKKAVAANKVANNASNTSVEKKLPPEIFPVKIDENGVKLFEPFEVKYNPKSVADDVSDWTQLHKKMPKNASPGSPLTINQEFMEFEIKPHNYVNDTDIIMTARDYTCDFQTYKIEDGKMSPINGYAKDGIACDINKEDIAFMKNGYTGQVGHYDDGRKFVSLHFSNGEMVDTRTGHEIITLVSNGSEFTQAQKDAIRIFKTLGDRKFGAGISTPFTCATITPANISDCSNIVRRTNRNVLLSVISSWAENSPKFNVDEYIQKTGDTFNIGF